MLFELGVEIAFVFLADRLAPQWKTYDSCHAQGHSEWGTVCL